MKPLTAEWVEKAEEDFRVAGRALRVRKNPTYNAVCFHAQQCVEKYLKARLQESGIAFPKTHHLPSLLQQVLPLEPLWAALDAAMQVLDRYSVNFRYPGSSADKAAARDAFKLCRVCRAEARRSLGLSD
jgi:HEPN domain-containing protein